MQHLLKKQVLSAQMLTMLPTFHAVFCTKLPKFLMH